MFVLPIHVDSSVDFNTLAISIGSGVGALVVIVLVCVVLVVGKLLIYMCMCTVLVKSLKNYCRHANASALSFGITFRIS